MAQYDEKLAVKSDAATWTALAKEGEFKISTKTQKFYWTAAGATAMQTNSQNVIDAANAYDAVKAKEEAQKVVDDVNAVK